jgi:superoxide dismutase, Fe-Mn family
MRKNMLYWGLPLIFFAFSCNTESNETIVEEISEPEAVYAEFPSVEIDPGAFQVPALNYAYNALEPHIDARTMEIHHSKHHAAYTNNLNKAVAGSALESQSIFDILSNLDMNNAALRNNAGGFYNHNLFWEVMSPNGGGQPEGALAEAINEAFGSYEAFAEGFKKAALGQFGSGWAWLYVKKDGKLAIGGTANQDNPLMPGLPISGFPILGVDVWEHAYYLNYQNKRADYVDSFFKVIDWSNVATKFEKRINYEIK